MQNSRVHSLDSGELSVVLSLIVDLQSERQQGSTFALFSTRRDLIESCRCEGLVGLGDAVLLGRCSQREMWAASLDRGFGKASCGLLVIRTVDRRLSGWVIADGLELRWPSS